MMMLVVFAVFSVRMDMGMGVCMLVGMDGIAMMVFMGVRKPVILALVPLGTTLFLSLAFRTFLHVLLP